MRKGGVVVFWVLQVLLAALFLAAASGKLTSNEQMVEMFEHWGYPNNFYLLVGTIEAGGAIGLLIPKLTPFAASALTVIMIGATATHLVHGESRWPWPALVAILLVVIAYARRPEFLRREQDEPS